MLGSWHVESTYLGSFRSSVLYACRKELQNVTSPTMPTACAPPETADCICGLMSAVPELTGITGVADARRLEDDAAERLCALDGGRHVLHQEGDLRVAMLLGAQRLAPR